MYCVERAGSLQVPPPRGMGFIEPVSFVSLLSTLNPAQWFGKGRREADIITGGILPKLSAFLTAVRAELGVTDYYGCGEIPDSVPTALLVDRRDQVARVADVYLSFLRDRSIFSDGRASGQAASGDMPQLDGTGDYGKFASGGAPVTSAPNGKPVCGGLLGQIDRALMRRGPGGQQLPAAVGPVPEIVQVPAPEGEGEEGPWWAGPWLPSLETAPAAPSSSSSSSAPAASYYGSGGGGGSGGRLLPGGVVSTAGPSAAGGAGIGTLLLLAAGVYLFSRPVRGRR